MQVPELMPEIALLEGFGVGGLEVIPPRSGEGACRPASGERLKHRQVGRTRLVQPCQHRIHGPHASLRGYEEVGPSFTRMGHAVLVRDGLEGGGVINFVEVNRNLRFEISLDAADRAGLRIDSALLAVAAHVDRVEVKK